jgi:hypothetical protein
MQSIVYSLRRGCTRLEMKTAVNQLVQYCTCESE